MQSMELYNPQLGYDPGLGFSLGGLVKSVGSAVSSVANTAASAAKTVANTVSSGVVAAARVGVGVVSSVAQVGCGVVQAAAPVAAMAPPNPYSAAAGVASTVCSMANPPPRQPAQPVTTGIDPYANVAPSVPVGPTVIPTQNAPTTTAAARYPAGTIYAPDPRRPGYFRVAIPVGTSLGHFGAAVATHVETQAVTTPPAGGTPTTVSDLEQKTGQTSLLRSPFFWGAVGTLAVGGAVGTGIYLKRRRSRR